MSTFDRRYLRSLSGISAHPGPTHPGVRNPGSAWIHARLASWVTPLRFAKGTLRPCSPRSCRVRRYFLDDHEYLYVLTFCLPDFLNQSFEQKLMTVFHELYHMHPQFDGDLRGTAGDTTFIRDGSATIIAICSTTSILGKRTRSHPVGFPAMDFTQLQARHQKILEIVVPRPKLIHWLGEGLTGEHTASDAISSAAAAGQCSRADHSGQLLAQNSQPHSRHKHTSCPYPMAIAWCFMKRWSAMPASMHRWCCWCITWVAVIARGICSTWPSDSSSLAGVHSASTCTAPVLAPDCQSVSSAACAADIRSAVDYLTTAFPGAPIAVADSGSAAISS